LKHGVPLQAGKVGGQAGKVGGARTQAHVLGDGAAAVISNGGPQDTGGKAAVRKGQLCGATCASR
jgi:hypothetical protein